MSGEWNVVRADIVGLGWDDQYVVRDSDRNVIAGPVTKAMAFEIAAKHNALATEANYLKVELESVKEQSLRVVIAGDPICAGEIIVGATGLEKRNYMWKNGVGYNDGLGVRSVCDHDWMDISEDETAFLVALEEWR